jgi:hypothetical protein
MGYIASSTTITARAYLTEKGREYLFNKNNVRFDSLGNDLFEIKTFTLGDADINYTSDIDLSTGQVPDISGKNESCLKTAINYQQKNLLFYQNFDQLVSDNVNYTVQIPDNILNISLNNIPNGTDTNNTGTDSGAGSGNGSGMGSGDATFNFG